MLIRPGLRRGTGKRGFFAGGTQFNFAQTTLAALLAAGLSNAVATTSPPGTVIGSTGVVQYGAHNLLKDSSDVSTASWSKWSCTIQSAAGSPLITGGGLRKIVPAVTSAPCHVTNASLTTQGAGTYTLWSVVKAAEYRYAGLAGYDGTSYVIAAAFDLQTGTVVSSGTWSGTSSITALSDGAFLIACTGTATAALQSNFTGVRVWTSLPTGINTQAQGDGSGGLLVSAVQLNLGTRVLDYVPTGATPVYAPRLTCERGATSNWLQWSDDPSNAYWTKTATTVAAAGLAPPRGYSQTWVHTATASAAGARITSAPFTTSVAGTYSYTVCVRQGSVGNFTVLVYNFTDATSVVSSALTFAGGAGKPIGDGWYEFTISGTIAAGKSIGCYLYTGSQTLGDTIYFAGASLQVAAPGAIGPFLRTFGTAPLYSAGTPTSQNLVPWSDDFTQNTSVTSNVTRNNATTCTIGATASAAYAYKLVGGLTIGTTYTVKVRISGPAGRAIAVRAADNGNGTFQAYQLVTLTATPTTYTLRVTLGASSGVDVGIDNRTAYGAANCLTGDVINIDQVQVYEGTADLGYTATTGAASSTYPQLGLVSEGASTNLHWYGTQVGNAGAWFVANCTCPQNQALAPDGTNTASALTENTTTASHPTWQDNAGLANTTAYTYSIYAKAAGRSQVKIDLAGTAFPVTVATLFDLSTGTASVTAGTATVSLIPVGAGWFRCIVTATTGAAGGVSTYVQPAVAGNATFLGVGTAALYLWGSQLEQRAIASTVIPTPGGATVTRAGDVLEDASIAGFNAAAFTIRCSFIDYQLTTDATKTSNYVYRATGPGNAMLYRNGGTGAVNTYDGATAASSSGTAIQSGVPTTVVASRNGGSQYLSANGAAASSAAWNGNAGSGTWQFGASASSDGFSGVFTAIEFGPAATAAQVAQLAARTLN